MKRLSLFPFALLLALTASAKLAAADPESSFGLAPAPAPPLTTPAPDGQPSSNPLIPDLGTPGSKGAAADAAPKQSQTEAEEDKQKKRIQIRQAYAKAERDPGLQAIKAQALAAHTDFEQRALFIQYYEGIVKLMGKFDKTLTKEQLDAQKASLTGRYYQSRIEPTVDPATFRKK